MNQKVSKIDNLAQIGNQRGYIRCNTPESCQSFTNNLELTLDGGPEHAVGKIII